MYNINNAPQICEQPAERRARVEQIIAGANTQNQRDQFRAAMDIIDGDAGKTAAQIMRGKPLLTSGNEKTAGILCDHLAPVITCPVECRVCAFAGCYAVRDFIRLPECRATWTRCTSAFLNDRAGYFAQLLDEIPAGIPCAVRLSTYSDVVDVDHAARICDVARKRPRANFGIYTKNPAAAAYFAANAPENLHVRFSTWHGIGADIAAGLPLADCVAPGDTGAGACCPCNHGAAKGACARCGICYCSNAPVYFNEHGTAAARKAAKK